VAYASDNNVYSEDKPNIAIDAQHSEFVIKLKSNPTTGYAWFLREYNHNLITPVKHTFQGPSTKLMGAPGYELWTFKMKPDAFIVPQQMTIRFIYARPWQGADSSTQVVFRVTTTAK
jgi:inhibitor of cysteine peptidase